MSAVQEEYSLYCVCGGEREGGGEGGERGGEGEKKWCIVSAVLGVLSPLCV